MATLSPVAFLLVKFQGSPAEPISVADATQMFTASGRGTLNVVDWFDDNTHGNVDMAGNRVFGWLTLTETLADYDAKRTAGTYGRTAIIDLGRAAAVTAGVDLTPFVAVVVVTNVGVDLFGGTGFACCTAARGTSYWENHMAPSVLCQEMIHGLGVYDHTRRHGSDADYQDPYDVMSMYNAYPGHHPNDPDLPIGPGLNAAFMKRCGWLDPARGAPLGVALLRPLHRRDLQGPLYAEFDGFFVEYRKSAKWDAGFSSVVLVHYIKNNTSYLMAELHAGNPAFEWSPGGVFFSKGLIRVEDIDDVTETATITTSHHPRRFRAGPARSLFQTEFGGGAGLVFVNGKLIRIPPRSPEMRLVEAAATLASIEETEVTPALKTAVRADIYGKVLAEVGEAREHMSGATSVLDHISLEAAAEFQKKRS